MCHRKAGTKRQLSRWQKEGDHETTQKPQDKSTELDIIYHNMRNMVDTISNTRKCWTSCDSLESLENAVIGNKAGYIDIYITQDLEPQTQPLGFFAVWLGVGGPHRRGSSCGPKAGRTTGGSTGGPKVRAWLRRLGRVRKTVLM